MPYMINGIGTWHYGKRNIHRIRGVCSQCGAVTDLESYDTTLYFVVFLVPIIPLARRRVLEACPACNQFRMVPLKQWERTKQENVAAVLEKLRADPDDRETILAAIAVAATYQDEPLFDKLSEALAADRTDDAQLQAALGEANGYFARHERAAEAYMHSLRAADDPRVREQLGLTLLRLGDPAQAAGCFRHILDEADAERLWHLYQLVVAYQAKGMHAEALELLDRVGEKFPATADVKEWKKLRTISEKDRGRGRPVGKSALVEGRGAGTREGSRLSTLVPKLALPLILLAFAGWHTWKAVTLAGARPMFLVNGTTRPYTVAVNGTAYQLSPGVAKPVELPEGAITFAPGPGAEGVEPGEVRVESSFWARPYDRTRVVINPDRLAILSKETNVYAETPQPNPPDEYFTGRPLYEFADINHAFEAFPATVKIKRGRIDTRTRLGVAPITGAGDRIGFLVSAGLSQAEMVEYGRRWLAVDPDDPMALAWFASVAPPDVFLATVKGRLDERPLRVEWHRVYQTMTERAGGDTAALRGEYRKLVEETGRDPDALYLLARVSDRAEGLALLREAAGSGKPAERAHYALGYRLLCEGDYAAAAAEMDKAAALTRGPAYREPAHEALLAAKRYRDLIRRIDEEGGGLTAMLEKVKVCELAGDPAGADAAAAAALAAVPFQADGSLGEVIRAAVTATRAAAKGDAAAYLAAAGKFPGGGSVTNALLRGDLAAAEDAAKEPPPGDAAVVRGLILLATPPGHPARVGAAKAAFLAALATGDRDEKKLKELLERGGAVGPAAVRELTIAPKDKRVYAAAVAVWFPLQRAEFLALARELDFHGDAISLALPKLTGTAAKPAGRP